jgi:hypothetical protein
MAKLTGPTWTRPNWPMRPNLTGLAWPRLGSTQPRPTPALTLISLAHTHTHDPPLPYGIHVSAASPPFFPAISGSPRCWRDGLSSASPCSSIPPKSIWTSPPAAHIPNSETLADVAWGSTVAGRFGQDRRSARLQRPSPPTSATTTPPNAYMGTDA